MTREEDYEYDVWIPVNPWRPPPSLMQYGVLWSDGAESIHYEPCENWPELCNGNDSRRYATYICFRRMWRLPPRPNARDTLNPNEASNV